MLAAELSDPTFVPFDPARAERNFAELEQRVRDGLGRQGVDFSSVELFREVDMRYTMQLAEDQEERSETQLQLKADEKFPGLEIRSTSNSTQVLHFVKK